MSKKWVTIWPHGLSLRRLCQRLYLKKKYRSCAPANRKTKILLSTSLSVNFFPVISLSLASISLLKRSWRESPAARAIFPSSTISIIYFCECLGLVKDKKLDHFITMGNSSKKILTSISSNAKLILRPFLVRASIQGGNIELVMVLLEEYSKASYRIRTHHQDRTQGR